MSGAALVATARIAWRQARRAPGRSALVVTMIAMPIAGLTLGATLIRTSVPTLEEDITGEMGSAELRLESTVSDMHDLPALERMLEKLLPKGSRTVVIRQWNNTQVVNGSVVYASVWEPSIPIDRPPLPGLYELMDGRAPTRPGEAAVDPGVLDIFETQVGQDLTMGGRSFRVVGIAVRPRSMWDPLVVVAPGTLTSASPKAGKQLTDDFFVNSLLVDLPKGADPQAADVALEGAVRKFAVGGGDPAELAEQTAEDAVWTREDRAAQFINDVPTLTGVSFAGTTLVLFGTGLITAAAFAVGIRRQLRMLGLIGATGGEPSHVRAAVLLGGTSLGVIGAVAGVLVGIAGAYALTPSLHRFTHALPGKVLLPWATIIGAALLGVLAATVAAAWPARLASRISTLDALAARMPPPRPPGRVAKWGLVVVLVGAVLTVATARQGSNQAPLAAGLVLMLCGFLVAVPLLVDVAGRFAPILPPAPRLAVRETARYGRRSGIAIAATAIALTLPVGATALTLSEEAFQRRAVWMGDEHMLIGTVVTEGDEPVRPSDALIRELRGVLPGAIVASHRPAQLDLKRYAPPAEFGRMDAYPAYVEGRLITLEGPGGGNSYREQGQVFIGGPDLLRALKAEEGMSALEAGKIVAVGPDTTDNGTVYLTPPSSQNNPPKVPLDAVEAGEVRYNLDDSLPKYVISPGGARALGFLPGVPSHETLVAARAPLTLEETASVKKVAAQHPGTYIKTVEDFVPQFGALRIAYTAAAAIIALAIVAVTVSLVGAEARRDQAILVAIGAAPRARRRIAAARGGLIALIAGLIAIPAGFMPVALFQWSRPESYPVVVPWTTMVLVAVGVPLVTVLFGALTSRAPKAMAMLQPLN